MNGLLNDGFDAVYLGFGAMAGMSLGVPGDDLPGNVEALDLLRRHHRGEDVDAEGKALRGRSAEETRPSMPRER